MKSRRAWNSAQRLRTMSIGPLSAATPAAWLTEEGLSELCPCMRAMARMQGQRSLNPSSVSQAAGVAALNGPMDIVRSRCAEFQARRDFIVPRLNAVPGLSCDKPHGAFYVYVSCAGWIGKKTPQGTVIGNDADVCVH